MGKGKIACYEIACYKLFLLFPQCFQKACFPGASKCVIVWEWVNSAIAMLFETDKESILENDDENLGLSKDVEHTEHKLMDTEKYTSAIEARPRK